ncbi:MAG: ABC transporter permease subunit [Desulfobacterales bacterium]
MPSERISRKMGICGATLLAVLMLVGVLAPWISPHDPYRGDLSRRLEPPSRSYPLGTDALGRCVASRLLHATGTSLGAALAASATAFLLGAAAGISAALAPPGLAALLATLIDAALAMPALLLAVVLAGLMNPSLSSTVFALALVGWPWWARWLRAMTRQARRREFVTAAEALGLGGGRILSHYLLPQIAPAAAVAFAVRTGTMLVAVSGLSYLGLGAQPPQPEWGRMLEESRLYLGRAPWLLIAPAAAVSLCAASCQMIAESLRQRVPPGGRRA